MPLLRPTQNGINFIEKGECRMAKYIARRVPIIYSTEIVYIDDDGKETVIVPRNMDIDDESYVPNADWGHSGKTSKETAYQIVKHAMDESTAMRVAQVIRDTFVAQQDFDGFEVDKRKIVLMARNIIEKMNAHDESKGKKDENG